MLRTKVRIAVSALGVFLGVSAFICFAIVYANIEAGMWALLSAILPMYGQRQQSVTLPANFKTIEFYSFRRLRLACPGLCSGTHSRTLLHIKLVERNQKFNASMSLAVYYYDSIMYCMLLLLHTYILQHSSLRQQGLQKLKLLALFLQLCLKAGLSLILHCHYLKESLHANFSRKSLQYIGDIGIFGLVSGTALTVFYIFMECYTQADIMPIQTSIIIRMVWSFMMMKWGLLLYLTTRDYLRTYNDHQLFSENPHIEAA